MFAALLLVGLAWGLRADAIVAIPFSNQSNDRSLNWIGESIAEAVLETAHGQGLVVLDRADRAEAFQRLSLKPYVPLSRASIVKVGDELDASHVVYGSFEMFRSPSAAPESQALLKPSIRIRAWVLDLKQLRQSSEITLEGLLEDLATLQSGAAWKSVRSIDPVRWPESEPAPKSPRIRLDAIENYTRGLLAVEDAARHRFFTQATRLDENYSQPRFQLGLIYWQKEEYQQAASWFQKVLPSDVHFHEALFYSAICRYNMAEYAAAEREFERVAAHVPLNEVFSNLGCVQLRLDKLPAAVENFERALDGDPADPDYHFNLAYGLWRSKRFEEAAERFRAVLERIPEDQEATSLLGLCLKKEGPRPGDHKYEGLARIKEEYEETVYRQLKSLLEKK